MRQINLPMPIWDIPIRLFHWLLVLLIAFMWVSGKQGWLEYHMLSGYAILSLLIFRVVWGFVGSDTARFLFFLKSPIEAVRHLLHITKREPDTEIGHNAAGGWMVLAMLLLLLGQVTTGLLASNEDSFVEGPLNHLVGSAWGAWALKQHNLLFTGLQLMIAAHLFAIMSYAVLKHHNLVRPMITGKKRLPAATAQPRMRSPLLALAILAGAAIVVWLLVTKL